MAREAPGADELRRDLDGAIERGEFRLEFQPIVRLGGGTVVGAEALLRWRHPRRGTIAPNDFLPVIEQAEITDRLGAWVLDQAARAATGWPRTTERPGFVSVNVVPSSLRPPRAASGMLSSIAAAGLDPRMLTVELTSGVAGDVDQLSDALGVLRDAGVKVALDDFGMTTSLADLKQLPIDQVKLAREFVGAINGPAQESAFALSLISLAEVRGAEVVAKGVESREQAWRLAEVGCRYGQGFFFSKPLGASGVLAVLRKGTLRG